MRYDIPLTAKQQKEVADYITGESWNLPDANHKWPWRSTQYMDMLDVYWRLHSEFHQREALLKKTAQLVIDQTAAEYFAHVDIVIQFFESVAKGDFDVIERICYQLLKGK